MFALYQGRFRPNKEIKRPDGGGATLSGLRVVVFSFEMKLALALILVAPVAVASLTAPAYAQPELTQTDPPARQFAVGGQEGDDNGGPDILLKALITAAVIGGAAVLTTLLYLVRRSIGFEPHRPPEGDEGGGEEH